MSLSRLHPGGVLSFLDQESIGVLDQYGTTMPVQAGQMLIQEGQVQITLYVVVAGVIEVYRVAAGNEVHLADLLPGDCFGEVSIFQPDVASAHVRPKEPSELWAMTTENLQSFLGEYPHAGCALMLGINMLLSQRLARACEMIRNNSIVPGFLSVRKRLRAAQAKAATQALPTIR
jgi:CRP-like cAMP-binding protein